LPFGLHREASNSHRNKNRLKEIFRHKKKGRLLEIGCGKGELLKLAKKHFNVEGIDISEYAARHIEESLGIRVDVSDIEKMELKSNHYDVVAGFNFLEHLKNPEGVVKRIYRSLKEGGIFVGSVPNNSGLIGKLFTQVTNLFDRTHLSTHPPNYWHSSFKKAQFQTIEFFGEVNFGINYNKYVRGVGWRYVSLNLMFECIK